MQNSIIKEFLHIAGGKTHMLGAYARCFKHEQAIWDGKVQSLDRIKSLREKAFQKKKLDTFLIFGENNLLYLTGIPGMSCLLVPSEGRCTLFVYSVNYELAKAEARGFNVEMVKRGEELTTKLLPHLKALKPNGVAVDSLTYEAYSSLAKHLKGKARVATAGDLVWEMRKVKDEGEVKLMKKAADLTSAGMKAAYETIRSGRTEIEVAAEIEYAMRRKGSWGTAFESLVSSGISSAFPHGGCTEKKIRSGDLVVVDIGAAYHNYCSDMTRTMVAGKPTEKQKKLYAIVSKAQEKAFEAIRPGAKAKDVDLAARRVIEKAGYGEFFVHGLGHGIGLEVHEPPSLSPLSKDKLTVGNVVSNEPGVYLVNYGGVRIEDSVLLTRQAAETLTVGPYSLETQK
jgi:Xaa-Pro aminopeptidase